MLKYILGLVLLLISFEIHAGGYPEGTWYCQNGLVAQFSIEPKTYKSHLTITEGPFAGQRADFLTLDIDPKATMGIGHFNKRGKYVLDHYLGACSWGG